MIALVQRVRRAVVRVDGEGEIARIGRGAFVLLCVERDDSEHEAVWMARKIRGLRIFDDAAGRMNLDLAAVGGELLLVSQFTLAAEVTSGQRPGFSRAAPPSTAQPLFDRVASLIRASSIPLQTGRFGASMEIELVNQGPVTIPIRSQSVSRSMRTRSERQ